MYEKEKKVALQIVREASLLAKKIEEQLLPEDIVIKDDGTPVTLADYVCQVFINYELKKAFPHDSLIGEESAFFLETRKGSPLVEKIHSFFPDFALNTLFEILDESLFEEENKERFWVIDPIDGTKGFIKHDQYVVALALIEKGEVVLGILGCPNFEGGIILEATKHQGTTLYPLNGGPSRKIKIDHGKKHNVLIYSEPHSYSVHHSHHKAHEIAAKIHAHPRPFPLDSQCKYAVIALEIAGIYLRIPTPFYQEKSWDHAAGMLVVKEAGGVVTDLKGEPLHFDQGKILSKNCGIIASAGPYHPKAVEAAKAILHFQ